MGDDLPAIAMLRIFLIFTPIPWGNDSQFDGRIFFKGVGEKPPTRKVKFFPEV